MFISVILLAGGQGTRMGSATPKQFIPLDGKPIARHSFDLFASLEEISEIIVVCQDDYHSLFISDKQLKFAQPGIRRQDSVYNGLQLIDTQSTLVCIHDAARPHLQATDLLNVLDAAILHKAAVLAVPVKNTIKECCNDQFVIKTHDRSKLWEIQTPQVIEPSLLKKGFEQQLEVTDDVSLIENLGLPVKVVKGSYTNLKITTPEDLYAQV